MILECNACKYVNSSRISTSDILEYHTSQAGKGLCSLTVIRVTWKRAAFIPENDVSKKV